MNIKGGGNPCLSKICFKSSKKQSQKNAKSTSGSGEHQDLNIMYSLANRGYNTDVNNT